MFAALRIEDLGVIGEKGTKVCAMLCSAWAARNIQLGGMHCSSACAATTGFRYAESVLEMY